MDIQKIINKQVTQNYSDTSPWPEVDEWHNQTYHNILKLKNIVEIFQSY